MLPLDPNHVSLVSPSISPQVSDSSPLALPSSDQALPELAAENRRSGRPLVPSKRTDQMNMIGSKKVSLISSSNKSENVPPGQRPEWVDIVKQRFLECDLGHEWASCIEGWLVVEEKLGFETISGCKVRSLTWRQLHVN
jgi:hypothetical protein